MHKLYSFFFFRRAIPLSFPSFLCTQLLALLKTMCPFFVKCPHEVECKMATVLIRRAHAVNCVEQSVPLGDKRRPGTLVPDEKIRERELKEGGFGGGTGAVF